ncbi:MAG TPA: LCP family protein, partial [Actinotalea sp.]
RDRWVLMSALSLLLLVVVGAGSAILVIGYKLQQNIDFIGDPFAELPSRPPAGGVTSPGATPAPVQVEDAMNILVVGSDSRISAGDPTQWEAGAQRTDVIMLVHLPADGSAAYLMSVPRDSWVEIPGHGQAKINAAFSLGGTPLLIQTFEQLTGVRIDHVALTDFESFKAITDALGGVEIALREDLVNKGQVVATAGPQILTGDQALIYVRQRKNLARGDFDRVQRQQAWMRSIFLRMRSQETLLSPSRWGPVLDAVSHSVALDDGFTRSVQEQLIRRLAGLKAEDVRFFTVPLAGTGRSADGQSIVLLKHPQFDGLMAAVASDTLGTYLEAHPDDVENLPRIAP